AVGRVYRQSLRPRIPLAGREIGRSQQEETGRERLRRIRSRRTRR
ncbi:hypothetical protein LCGC14_1480080, partial [marine sediment metagenome]